jgi:hypothetical protein
MNAPRSVVGFIAILRLLAAVIVLATSSCGALPELALVNVSVVNWRNHFATEPHPVLLVEVAQNGMLKVHSEAPYAEAHLCGALPLVKVGWGGFYVRRPAVDRPPSAAIPSKDFGGNVFAIIELSDLRSSVGGFRQTQYDLRNDSHDICLQAADPGFGFWGGKSSNTVRIPRSAITAALARAPETPPALMDQADWNRTAQ